MNIKVFLVLCIAFFSLNFSVFAQQNKEDKNVKAIEKVEQKETSKPDVDSKKEKIENKDQIQRCFDDYAEADSIRFCLKVAYEKSERKRHFIQEKMFDVLVEQNFMSEGEQAKIDKLKMKRDALKNKKIEGKNKEEAKAAAMEKIFAIEDEKAILTFEGNNENEREKALEKMKASDTDFEKYRTTECERQQHFYASNAQFAQFVFYTCMYNLTEQRTETLQNSLK